MRIFKWPVAAGFLVWASLTPVHAQTVTSPALFLVEITGLADTDPTSALSQIDLFLANRTEDDPRVTFDLLLLKANLLEQTGQTRAAVRLFTELAQLVQEDRNTHLWDPVTLFERAVTIHEREQNWRLARRVVTAILEEQRDGAHSAADIAQTLERLADLSEKMGDASGKASYLAQADATRAAPAPTRSATDGDGFRTVRVFYATDRARSGDDAPASFYSGNRGDLELGIAEVTVPDSHEPGVIEAPSIWRLNFAPNPTKHIVLQSVTPVDADAFFSTMNTDLSELGSQEAFVFIHGYNVRFDGAAKRAAQIAYDVHFPGVPILFSWPSRGTTAGYISDAAVVRLSGRRLAGFLEDLQARSNANTIHIIAHSMGNRALTDALEIFALKHAQAQGAEPAFEQVLFAAPDVDADLFDAMMQTIRPVARRFTLYASEQDWALNASQQLHGDAPRAGQGGAQILASPEFDSIDMSDLGDDMLAHSYFSNDSSALADIASLFWKNVAPQGRCGLEQGDALSEPVPVWLYVTENCKDGPLVDILAHLRKANVRTFAAAQVIVREKVQDQELADFLMPILRKILSE